MTEKEIIETTISYIQKNYYPGPHFCNGQRMDNLVHHVMNFMRSDATQSSPEETTIAEDVAPAESEFGHYTSGGIDKNKDTGGFSGFANGAT